MLPMKTTFIIKDHLDLKSSLYSYRPSNRKHTKKELAVIAFICIIYTPTDHLHSVAQSENEIVVER